MVALNDAGEHNSITLNWIKAHADHPGNEKADKLAKEGASRSEDNIDGPNISEATCRSMVRKAFEDKWQALWWGRTDCRQTKQWFPSPLKSRSYDLLKKGNRKFLSGMVQLITGHNYLKRHEALVNDTEELEAALCRLCQEDEETSFHLVARCPALITARTQQFLDWKLDEPFQWQVKTVLHFLRDSQLESLLFANG